jgi:uncharacterized protein (TIGR03435 family)
VHRVMKKFYSAPFGILAATLVFGQTQAPSPPAKLEFEVASIHLSQSTGLYRVDAGLKMDGSQAHFSSLSISNLITLAYRVQANQISGPDWLPQQRFDISAKLPDGATTAQIPEMLQSLLAERFQLKMHHETKEMPAYALVLGKSPLKLKETPPDSDAHESEGAVTMGASGGSAGVTFNLGNGSYSTFANDQFDFKKVTMDVLATQLARYLDRPVVNMTTLKNNYDLTLQLTPEDYRALLIRSAVNAGVVLPPQALRLLDNGPAVSLFDALDQLGLHLDARKLPLDLIVVDSALQTPTDN